MSDPTAQTPTDPAAVIAALADPARQALYDLLRQSDRPLARDELAAGSGLPLATAAFHLDKLVEVGALTVEFARRTGRTGPGAGRPAKFYALASEEVNASVPPRRYDLVGDILVTAAEESDRTGTPMRECLVAVAESRGHEFGDEGIPLADTLAEVGYAPAPDGEGGFRLTNCPFHQLAARHTDLICSANTAFVRGLADESPDERSVWLEPASGHCCVRIGAVEGAVDSAG
ncbi:helix-turn-helix transcriptional regulator [Leifsonia sp. NPDC058248]|uniref:helix-turn-helix transcriptional regulator n=1 Tax=Leifsonia sp. NPDC058248 TaxID=3346402 RepID=UPI0036DB4D31